MEKMERVLSPEEIDKYVKKQMGESREMLASQLPLEMAEDFVKIIYVRLYGQRKNMSYLVGIREERELNGFVMLNLTQAEGHLIGNHTYSHMQLTKKNREKFKEELVRTDGVLEELMVKRNQIE